MSYEFVRPAEYWDAKTRAALRASEDEIKRLTGVSVSQSRHLAQALKEKNDLLAMKDGQFTKLLDRNGWLEGTNSRLQLDLKAAQQQLRDLKTHATLLLKGLGVL
jgi:hypothetical protein